MSNGSASSASSRTPTRSFSSLADVLLSLSESPCTVRSRPEPIDPALLASLVEGLVDNRLSALGRMGAAQTDPVQARVVFDGIRATGKEDSAKVAADLVDDTYLGGAG